MPKANDSLDIPNPAGARRWLTPEVVLPLLLMGLIVRVNLGDSGFGLSAGILMPLVAAWWARREGLAVVPLVALLNLVPRVIWPLEDVIWPFEDLTLAFGYSFLLLAAGAAIACTPGDGPGRVGVMLRHRWRIPFVVAMGWLVIAACAQIVVVAQIEHLMFQVNVMAIPSLVVMVLAFDWNRLADTGRSNGKPLATLAGAWALACAVAVALVLLIYVKVGAMGLRVGFANATSLAPTAAFVSVLCGWARWPHLVLLFALAALLAEMAIAAVGPIGSGSPFNWNLGS